MRCSWNGPHLCKIRIVNHSKPYSIMNYALQNAWNCEAHSEASSLLEEEATRLTYNVNEAMRAKMLTLLLGRIKIWADLPDIPGWYSCSFMWYLLVMLPVQVLFFRPSGWRFWIRNGKFASFAASASSDGPDCEPRPFERLQLPTCQPLTDSALLCLNRLETYSLQLIVKIPWL